MKKEASILRELLELNQNHMDRFARLNICESQRQLLRKFLTGIHTFKFPMYDLNNKYYFAFLHLYLRPGF
jgi:hypothetical protein